MSPVQPFVSVIIPVFNDSKRLVTCLTALSNQSYGQENYEVIVADNGSTDDISSAAKEFSVTLVSEKKPGSYAARNKGLSVAKGEILAFTDADCIPREDWVETGVKKVLESQNCGLIAGRIDVILKDPENPSIIEFFDSATAFPQKHFIEADKFGATANIFTTKKVIKNVGGFNSELKSNGDREWGNRVHKAGYALIYDHSLCVRHPARHKFSQIRKKYARLIGGQHDLNTKQGNYSIYKFSRDIIRDLKLLDEVLDVFLFKNERRPISIEAKKLNIPKRLKLVGFVLVTRYLRVSERFRLFFMKATSDRG